MAWDIDGPQGFESRKIKYLLPKYTRGRVLEIGCGMEKAFPHFIGYDSGHHFGRGAADIMGGADGLELFADESLDAIFSSHVLEHMQDMRSALNEWGRVIKPGGYLCLYVPSANLYPRCGEHGANPDHKHDIYPGNIAKMLERLSYCWTQVECEERGEGIEYSIFEVYRKDEPRLALPVKYPNPAAIPRKTACIVRYGGFGDMLQAASILPQLKHDGYHVTVMTTPKGQDIIRHDPHVDDWYLQDTDQVPNNELAEFWHVQAQRFDKFINLSESIEGTLLAIPGRSNHAWPKDVRHRLLNRNYFDFTAMLGGVGFKANQLFYATPNEIERAEALCADHPFTVLWPLAGSSVHKYTPHQDAVIARIMLEIPEAQVILVGDDACRILEQGWENESRVCCLSGRLSIRDTLALAQRANLVIGPETGVLNCVAHDPNYKVVLLSHSSVKNLSQHWYNTISLTPMDCPCYPCHRLHYTTQFCNVDPDTGTALCMRNITPAAIWEAVWKTYQQWRKKQ